MKSVISFKSIEFNRKIIIQFFEHTIKNNVYLCYRKTNVCLPLVEMRIVFLFVFLLNTKKNYNTFVLTLFY